MDSLIFQAMAADLNRTLANSRVERVIQTAAETLVLRLWTGRDKRQLLLRADASAAFYLSSELHAAPAAPPRFCQLLRARLRRLLAIRAEATDRVARLLFAGADNERYELIIEGIAGQGNLILVDSDGRIVDLLRRDDGLRKLLPGATYQLPESRYRSLFAPDALSAALAVANSYTDLLNGDLAPMSPPLAQALFATHLAGDNPLALLETLRMALDSARFAPRLVSWRGRSSQLPCALGDVFFDKVETFGSLSAMLEADTAAQQLETPGAFAARLRTLVARQRKKLAKRVVDIEAERLRHADPDGFRIRGDLLLANLYRMKRGLTEITVDDYYQSPPTPLVIPLDSTLTPQANAEHCFKLYRKANRAGEHIDRRLAETRAEQDWLEQVDLALDEAVSGDDLYQVQVELETAGLLKSVPGKLGKRTPTSAEEQLHRATTPGGQTLYWGKNSRTNDYVSRRLTAADDLWFHARDMPGCHLVLKHPPGTEVAEEDVLFAAAFAAGYSKGRGAGKVEVLVAHGRAVKKPKGARPGLVTVEAFRTVMVAPRRLDA